MLTSQAIKITAALSGVALLLTLGAFVALSVRAADTAGKSGLVACKELTTMRALSNRYVSFTNSRTGDTMSYIVIGDGAVSKDLIVMFNGTSQISPDWPVQMFTNSKYSPKIVLNLAYTPAEDGNISLCHNYRFVFFDQAGIGNNPVAPNYTFDHQADDVDAMLDDIGTRFSIPTNRIDPAGWSLGTAAALKYTSLAPAANPARKIGNVVLIAAKPGGNLSGFFDGNQAQCATAILDGSRSPGLTEKFRNELTVDFYKITFPYKNQQPYSGVDSGCNANVITTTSTITFNVTLNCPFASQCEKILADYVVNRLTKPWSLTDGVSTGLFEEQRESTTDYSLFYCGSHDTHFNSTDCVGPQNVSPEMSATNGGVCKTTSVPVNKPHSTECVPLNIKGKLSLINGPEDLLIQWVYGRALIDAYQRQYGANKAQRFTYKGADGAGHAVLLQHPKWTQARFYQALQNP